MKKFVFKMMFALAVLVTAPFMLTGCGEEEEIPYELTVKSVVIIDGEKQDLTLTNYQALKAITEDGQYIGGNGYDLTAPEEVGYKFLGWYEDTDRLIGVLHNIPKWNMYDRDGYIEARYEPLNYTIIYKFVDENNNDLNPQSNPNSDSYNYAEDKLPQTVLNPYGAKTIENPGVVEHYEFVKWICKTTTEEKEVSVFPLNESDLQGDSCVLIGVYKKKTEQLTITCDDIGDINSIVVYYRNDHGEFSASVANVEGNIAILPEDWYEIEVFINQDTLSGNPTGLGVESWNIDGVDYATGALTQMGVHHAKINRETDSRFTGISGAFTIVLTMAE